MLEAFVQIPPQSAPHYSLPFLRRCINVEWYRTTGWNIFVKDVVAWINFEWPLHSQDQTRSVWRESDANLRLRTGTRSCGMALSHCTRIEAPHVRLVECCGCCSFCDCSASKMQFFSAPATPLAVRCRHLRITISSATCSCRGMCMPF